ncbi:MAG: HAD family hydrolase [Gemmataceae bacterium]|nr:HAD family hydrolase [Gemmataceae bacterium]
MILIECVLFDFDGTLADSFDAIAASVNHVRFVNRLSPLSLAEVITRVGHGLDSLMQATAPGVPLEMAKDSYRNHHEAHMESLTRLYPGAREFLTTLSTLGVRMAVCSNKPVAFTKRLLVYLQIAGFFQEVLGPEDVAERKPGPEMLIEGMKRLGADREKTLYLGDMQIDLEAAQRAGVRVRILDHERDIGFFSLMKGDLAFGPG